MKNKGFYLSLVCVGMVLASCETIVMDEDGVEAEMASQFAELRVSTRSGDNDGDENTLHKGQVYVLNEAGKCVRLLTTAEGSHEVTTRLSPGSYSLYGVGGSDLSPFVLPTKGKATVESAITLAQGGEMADLLMGVKPVTLTEGEVAAETMELTRKVACIKEVEIKAVPTTVTKVEVTIGSLYSAIRLNGAFTGMNTTEYKVPLTRQADGTTWSAQPQQMTFPSKGLPTIQVVFTSDEGMDEFEYTASEELVANHHVKISGTCNVAELATLTCSLSASAWGEDKAMNFDFDEGNMTFVDPVAGTFCNGYYVVAVDETAHQALLLAQENVDYDAPATDADASVWLDAVTEAMTSVEKPVGIDDNWRLPTLAEVKTFIMDPQVAPVFASGKTVSFFCLDGDVLKWAYVYEEEGIKTVKSGTSKMNGSVKLRPVIGI